MICWSEFGSWSLLGYSLGQPEKVESILSSSDIVLLLMGLLKSMKNGGNCPLNTVRAPNASPVTPHLACVRPLRILSALK